MMMASDVSNASKSGAPQVAAVVLNWNGGRMNQTCLDALLRCTYPSLEVIFVDNGSRDGSAEEVKRSYPQIEHLSIGENLGFCGGNNFGIRRALECGADMVLILNNDVEVSPDFLEPLVKVLEEKAGVVGPKIMDASNRIWCAGGELAFHQNLTRLRGFGSEDHGGFDMPETVDYMPACCLLVSREVFETIGYLDEAYFCYLEDVDFCIRSRSADFPVTYCPDSRIIHHFSHSTGGGYTPARKYMNALNSVHFLKAHGTLKSWLAFWLLDVLTLPPLFLLRLFQGRGKGAMAKARGILRGFTGTRVTREDLEKYFTRKEPDR